MLVHGQNSRFTNVNDHIYHRSRLDLAMFRRTRRRCSSETNKCVTCRGQAPPAGTFGRDDDFLRRPSPDGNLWSREEGFDFISWEFFCECDWIKFQKLQSSHMIGVHPQWTLHNSPHFTVPIASRNVPTTIRLTFRAWNTHQLAGWFMLWRCSDVYLVLLLPIS